MYQFYYAEKEKVKKYPQYKKNVQDEFEITAIRPTVWEEHCLECSAPECFNNCVHYLPRSDGRCKRFENGIYVYSDKRGCGGQAARVQFRKWANMMTHIFPAMLTNDEYVKLIQNNQHLGNMIRGLVKMPIPYKPKFTLIRIPEYLRRRKLRKLTGLTNQPDAFIFHGYSFEDKEYRLIVEVFDDHLSKFRMSLLMEPGENLIVIDKSQLNDACWTSGYLVKVYPENDLETELDILWCDFVQGKKKKSTEPAEKVKCVVWDLDHTLWDGILIETDDPMSLKVNQETMNCIKALDARGIIQSIASKNDYTSAWSVLEKKGIAEYFLYPQIHWGAKSISMEEIARQLNIGIDALALIDDSAFERGQVQSVWPQIRVYDPDDISSLLEKNEFDVMVTEESRNRRMMYRAEEKRNELKHSGDEDTVAFLKKCNLQMELFQPTTDEEKQRCYELVVRTNQLNMSGRKYSPEEFKYVFEKDGCKNFAFSCKDDFGSYGIVGYGQYILDRESLRFTEFAMSCRVAGKYVESALFSALLKKECCSSGQFKVSKTPKNGLLRATLEEIGFVIERDVDNKITYSYRTALKNEELVGVVERKE
ncbi:MAG: HAD-IIIC family phosphatase [Clostridiales bacterium]|nr:HAD-IIIC family phosphatase [Clostridiales bacterium]